MSLDSFMKGVLDVLTPIITPEWGKLVVLIPALLTLVVLAFVAVTTVKWIQLYRTAPAAHRAPSSGGHSAIVAPKAAKQVKAPRAPKQVKAPTPRNAAEAPRADAAAPKPPSVVAPEPPETAAAPKATKPAKASPGSTEKKNKRFWER
jgi:cytoskeletal protein RodZ